MTALERIDRESRPRRTALRMRDYERHLFCTRCDTLIAVFEAAQGATSVEEHQFIDPLKFVCSWCLEAGCRT